MSMVLCEGCDTLIDSDEDPDCFVEAGNMRRLHKQTVLCEWCRDAREANAEPCACRTPFAGAHDIDPPEPRRNKDCPQHGWARDPDDERERRREAQS